MECCFGKITFQSNLKWLRGIQEVTQDSTPILWTFLWQTILSTILWFIYVNESCLVFRFLRQIWCQILDYIVKNSWVISVIILYEQSCDKKIQLSCVLFLLYTNDFLRQTWLWILSRNNLVIQSCGTSQEYYKSCWENDNIVVTTVLWYFCYNLAKNIKVCLLRPKISWNGVWQQSCDSHSN